MTRRASRLSLGNRGGLSRSALHERFARYVRQPPMQYLARWRMQLGADLPRSGHSTVATIALEVGYESEAAFARAFKRAMGAAPATCRRSQALPPNAQLSPVRDQRSSPSESSAPSLSDPRILKLSSRCTSTSVPSARVTSTS